MNYSRHTVKHLSGQNTPESAAVTFTGLSDSPKLDGKELKSSVAFDTGLVSFSPSEISPEAGTSRGLATMSEQHREWIFVEVECDARRGRCCRQATPLSSLEAHLTTLLKCHFDFGFQHQQLMDRSCRRDDGEEMAGNIPVANDVAAATHDSCTLAEGPILF